MSKKPQIRHLAIFVRDTEKVAEFYQRVFEMELVGSKGPGQSKYLTDGHITLAWGRDYSDVSPIRGVLLGGAKHSLKVGVDVMPLDEPVSA